MGKREKSQSVPESGELIGILITASTLSHFPQNYQYVGRFPVTSFFSFVSSCLTFIMAEESLYLHIG